VPFHVDGKAVGTIWAIAHDDRRKFDAEDRRLLESLSAFASAAYKTVAQLAASERREEALSDILQQLDWAQRTLRESETRYRKALDVETIGVIFFDNQHHVTRINPAFERMSGYSNDDVNRATFLWTGLLPTDHQQAAALRAAQFDAEGRTTPREFEFCRKDGTRWWGLVTATRVSSTEGVKFVIDITDRKNNELARERAFASESAARAQAEHATKARDEILAVLAHDLRNPMNAILASASMLALATEQKDREHRIGIIQRATQGMSRLVTDLLEMAHIDSGAFVVTKETVDLRALIREALELCEAQATAEQIVLRAEIGDDVLPIVADRERLLQVLSNLVANALKFTGAGGTVSVRARNCDGGVQLSIKDSGAGISADDLPRIFDRFWQAKRASRAGAGLGLAICKGIVEAHGGRIWANSKDGHGTTFYIEIPNAPRGKEA
jgi:PAS domain S-box-containing protein